MKKSLVSLGIATALLVPAGAVYAQSDDGVAVDDTVTCRMVDGVGAQNGYGTQNARLDDGAPYGDPELCPLDGDQLQTRTRLRARTADAEKVGLAGEGPRYGGQSQARLAGDGFGDPDDCPFDGEGPRGLGNGAGPGFGPAGS